MKKIIFLGIIILIASFIVWDYKTHEESSTSINSFEECLGAGNPILESYPRQCMTVDKITFVEDIGNELEKQVFIRVSSPRPNNLIESPLKIKGEAVGYWFFEGDFPIKLLDSDGNELGSAIAKALSDWMTEKFVPFEAEIEFSLSATKKGNLIFEKDNPSGLPGNDDQLRIPVNFKEAGEIGETCKDLCGDGICQEMVCMAIGCPCAESRESCPQDCK
jgi:hypothetical protein